MILIMIMRLIQMLAVIILKT